MMAQTAKVITTGNISDGAAAWLLAHDCQIETSLGLSIILLSIEAEVLCYTHHNQYTIVFYDSEGEQEETYAVVELDIDAYETRVSLKKSVVC